LLFQFYYFAIVVNVILRGFWVLNLSLGYFDRVYAPGLSGALGVLELLRFGAGVVFELTLF
jgi:hypothetical protein